VEAIADDIANKGYRDQIMFVIVPMGPPDATSIEGVAKTVTDAGHIYAIAKEGLPGAWNER
jgi:hypothetical protein